MAYITKRAYPSLDSWRGARRFNQREAAKHLGISQNFYSRIERGIAAPRPPIAQRIMERTGVPLETILGVGR